MRYAVPARCIGVFSLLLLAISACAASLPEVDPVDIPRIRSQIATDPGNTNLQVELGIAEHQAGNYAEALAILQGAIDAGNDSGAAYLYLGMTHEHLENWAGARDAYVTYLETGRSDGLRDELTGRLALIAQNILRQQAQQALGQEAQISGAAATPHSIAILPFGFNSDRADLEPLIYAISDMMITDFSVANTLTVLERGQIQSLLDEMALTEAGYADAATGARAGRLLRAEHVVQGVITTLGGDNLRLDQEVLDIPGAASAGSLTNENQLENLFDIEKDLVFRTIRDILTIQLTPAEEARIRNNRTDNILAFLAYGRGLRERDFGNFATALTHFRQAQELDPDFAAAAFAADATGYMVAAAEMGTAQLARTAAATGVTGRARVIGPPVLGNTGSLAGSATTSSARTLIGASEGVNPTPTSGILDLGMASSMRDGGPVIDAQRQPVQESQGQESVTTTARAQIRIVVQRPSGAKP